MHFFCYPGDVWLQRNKWYKHKSGADLEYSFPASRIPFNFHAPIKPIVCNFYWPSFMTTISHQGWLEGQELYPKPASQLKYFSFFLVTSQARLAATNMTWVFSEPLNQQWMPPPSALQLFYHHICKKREQHPTHQFSNKHQPEKWCCPQRNYKSWQTQQQHPLLDYFLIMYYYKCKKEGSGVACSFHIFDNQ